MRQNRIWTVSNGMSMARVLFLIPLAYCLFTPFEGNRLWAGAVVTLAVITDFLDGFLARRLHQVSELGKVVDPLADKICVGVLGVLLLIKEEIPLWYVAVILLRDALIVAGGLYIRKKKNIITQSNWPGKFAVSAIAFYLFLTVIAVESLEGVRTFFLWFSLALMVFSLSVYAQRLFIGRQVGRQEREAREEGNV